eukprot:3019683-Amphidinium_carterae.1
MTKASLVAQLLGYGNGGRETSVVSQVEASQTFLPAPSKAALQGFCDVASRHGDLRVARHLHSQFLSVDEGHSRQAAVSYSSFAGKAEKDEALEALGGKPALAPPAPDGLKDLDSQCPRRAAGGQCSTEWEYMRLNCALSC